MQAIIDEIKKWQNDIAIECTKDFNGYELCPEIECFNHLLPFSMIIDFETATTIDLLMVIHERNLQDIFPNNNPRMILTISVTTKSCERSFSNLEIIKSY